MSRDVVERRVADGPERCVGVSEVRAERENRLKEVTVLGKLNKDWRRVARKAGGQPGKQLFTGAELVGLLEELKCKVRFDTRDDRRERANRRRRQAKLCSCRDE